MRREGLILEVINRNLKKRAAIIVDDDDAYRPGLSGIYCRVFQGTYSCFRVLRSNGHTGRVRLRQAGIFSSVRTFVSIDRDVLARHFGR